MIVTDTSRRWAAALALGLAGLIGASASLVLAAPARSAASPFELVLEARFGPWDFAWSSPEGGTFASRAPFCAGGGFENERGFDKRWRFTCDDGTGSLTLSLAAMWGSGAPLRDSTWHVVDGTGNYAGLRGTLSLRGEELCGDTCDVERPVPWRGTLRGVVDRDTVAPTIAFSRATATKLRRTKGVYTLRLGIAVRDDVTDNPVSYTVRVCAYTVDACAGRLELTRRFGTATNGAVSTTLRIRRPAAARAVQLLLTAEDPVGNVASISRAVRLPD